MQTFKVTKKKAPKITRDSYYAQERQKRPLYQDKELHCMVLSLVLCLLLEPHRGKLDDLYCHQFPVDNGFENILYILHQHLSHDSN